VSVFDQTCYPIRFDWGLQGLRNLSPASDITVIVDVLSFTTAVDVALSRQACVYPFPFNDDRAAEFAARHGALLAGKRGIAEYSLSPLSLMNLSEGERLVLPSPNGSTLSLESRSSVTIAGCLRNARAVAAAVNYAQSTVAVIAAGEQWPDGSLRPAIEDGIGAGAIIALLAGDRSPEADSAVAQRNRAKDRLTDTLLNCASGRELHQMGFADDVALAAEYDVSSCVPVLTEGAFVHNSRPTVNRAG
jgi:2-phosphosulfolactate phosphatase